MKIPPDSSLALTSLGPGERAHRVKAWAGELGFDLCGIARAESLEEESEFFRDWLTQGRHAEMTWLAHQPARRTDPRTVLENCRSVVVVGVNYHRAESDPASPVGSGVTGTDPASPGGYTVTSSDSDADTDSDNEADAGASGLGRPAGERPVGRVAQYARWPDYHRSMGKRLRSLARRIFAASGGTAIARSYVDTGPVLEKAWAQRAGLGFVGKNTCLIHPKRGSWFLLGVVLTTLDLEPDAPVPLGCGSCRRCLDACPTGALVEPGVLDSARCISYLTIEHRGDALPAEFDGRLDGWIFGCDICQDVCPYNRKLQLPAAEDGILGTLAHPAAIPLTEILGLDGEEEFLDWVGRRSPLRRAGLKGMKRTARCLLKAKGQGTPGTPGTPGTAETPETPGASGVSGISGVSGTAGTIGTAGAPGTPGTQETP